MTTISFCIITSGTEDDQLKRSIDSKQDIIGGLGYRSINHNVQEKLAVSG